MVLNFGGKELGFGYFLVVGDFLYEIREIVQRGLRECIFADGQLSGFGGSGETEIVGFDAPDLGAVAGVGVNGDEEIRIRAIGDSGAFFERNVGIVLAGENDFGTGDIFFDHLTQPKGDVEAEIFLEKAVGALGSGVKTAVAWIDNNAINLQTQFTSQGELSGDIFVGFRRNLGWLRFARVCVRVRKSDRSSSGLCAGDDGTIQSRKNGRS